MSKYLVTIAFTVEVPAEHLERIPDENYLRSYLENDTYVAVRAKRSTDDGYEEMIDEYLDYQDYAIGILKIDE